MRNFPRAGRTLRQADRDQCPHRAQRRCQSVHVGEWKHVHPPSRIAARHPSAGSETREFLKKYKTGVCEAYGNVKKEYVAVPNDLLAKTKELQKYLDVSYEYSKTRKEALILTSGAVAREKRLHP